ncbi:hypothetical protein REPUB_Repub15cG0083000 [Reevesia pubescens]
MASKGLSESSSSSGPKSKYEVFLSFRGEDTRKNFTDHLYAALITTGVNTFRDDDELRRGEDISSELLKAIQYSKISIVVFSKGYAYSRWCLNELVKIIECKNTIAQIVLPIFYDVDPSVVRKQTGSYAKAFVEHEERFQSDTEMINRWRSALTEAADLSGWDLQNIADGCPQKSKPRCRRVLIVLDDVDNSKQLNSLIGNRSWFEVGSRIIITTRDESLLTKLEVDERFKAEALNPEESLQLFSWHAFRWPNPKVDYFQLSKNVVDHVQGLPLALEVLGSHLFKRSQLEWESVVEQLRQIPHEDIHKKLKISFDTLNDHAKDIFLDIACFFIGMDKEYVMKILDGCGFFPVIGVSVLLERSLITLDPLVHTLKMHDLLRDMGSEIVRKESPKCIGKRSRLWFHQDVIDVLRKHTGSKAVEGISLDVSAGEDVIVSTEAFAKMVNLRLLKINSVHFATGCYEKFSKEIRWLCWHRCPLRVLPPDLHLDNLVVLDMRFSNVKKVWKETKFLQKLKILDLSYSTYLAETPNFAGLSNLESLEFEGCTSLTKVHQSIGQLERIVCLNLAECNNLRELPDSICNIRSLNTLNLNRCSKLNR